MADKLMDAVAFLSLDNSKFKRSARETERAMDHMADNMEDQIVRCTNANVRLANSQRNVAMSTRGAGGSIGSMTSGIGKLGMAMAAYVGVSEVVNRLNTWTALGDSIEEASQRTGVAVGTLSRLAYAANLAGSSLEGVEMSIRNMQKNIVNDPAAKVATSLNAIGLSASQLKAMGPEQAFFAILNGLSRVSDESERSAYALNIFGRAGAQALPLIADGMAGLKQQMDQAGDMGAVFTPESAASAARYSDAVENISTSFDGLLGTIFTATPALEMISATLEGMATAINTVSGGINAISNAAGEITAVIAPDAQPDPTVEMKARRRWKAASASAGSAYGIRGIGELDPKLRQQARTATVSNTYVVANANFSAGPDMKRAVNRNKSARASI